LTTGELASTLVSDQRDAMTDSLSPADTQVPRDRPKPDPRLVYIRERLFGPGADHRRHAMQEFCDAYGKEPAE
jgi:hypothetical protein